MLRSAIFVKAKPTCFLNFPLSIRWKNPNRIRTNLVANKVPFLAFTIIRYQRIETNYKFWSVFVSITFDSFGCGAHSLRHRPRVSSKKVFQTTIHIHTKWIVFKNVCAQREKKMRANWLFDVFPPSPFANVRSSFIMHHTLCNTNFEMYSNHISRSHNKCNTQIYFMCAYF